MRSVTLSVEVRQRDNEVDTCLLLRSVHLKKKGCEKREVTRAHFQMQSAILFFTLMQEVS